MARRYIVLFTSTLFYSPQHCIPSVTWQHNCCIGAIMVSKIPTVQFQNKYRIEPSRLKSWDYSSSAYYFITICTKNRNPCFGSILSGKVNLSETGQVAERYWNEIPIHFPFIKLDEHIIMPDHIHGILLIDHNSSVNTVEPCHGKAPTHTNKYAKPISGSVSVVVNQFKGAVMRWCKNNWYSNFYWQPRFYDSIIRDKTSLDNVRQYIIDNPHNW